MERKKSVEDVTEGIHIDTIELYFIMKMVAG